MPPTSLSLSQWLARLEALHPTEIELGLDRVRTVAERLPIEPNAKVITVAGTNGKGSCVAMLEALCLTNGKTVGAYTSPHFLRYNERVRINGREASDNELVRAFEQIDVARGDISLTYFEFGTLAAFMLFSAAELDYWVLEVGLGGRLDAVNIIDADIAVITSIDLDHQAWLGDSREAIGAEKAGIVRPQRPVICVDPDPPASVLQAVASSQLLRAGREMHWAVSGNTWSWSGVDSSGAKRSLDLPLPDLPLASVAAALQAALLCNLEVDADRVGAVVRELKLIGRRQQLSWRGRAVLLDVAHNPAAARELETWLAAQPQRAIAVFAVMADKDYAAMLRELAPSVSRWLFAGLANNERAATASQLQDAAAELGLAGEEYATVRQSFERALALAGANDLIVVCGSFYTVAAVLEVIDESGAP